VAKKQTKQLTQLARFMMSLQHKIRFAAPGGKAGGEKTFQTQKTAERSRWTVPSKARKLLCRRVRGGRGTGKEKWQKLDPSRNTGRKGRTSKPEWGRMRGGMGLHGTY